MSKKAKKVVVYSALEVANICGVVNQTAINWIRNGYLKAFQTPGGQFRVYVDDLVFFMHEKKMRIPSSLQEYYTENYSFVVIVENKGLNTVIAQFLERKFRNVKTFQAFDGFEAGSMISSIEPDCVVLDISSFDSKGLSLCKKIKKMSDKKIPKICAITDTHTKNEIIEKQITDGNIDFFIQKPLDMERFSTLIYECLRIEIQQ